MKHVFLWALVVALIIVSYFLGFVSWLWGFSVRDFRRGSNLIHSRVAFTKWVNA